MTNAEKLKDETAKMILENIDAIHNEIRVRLNCLAGSVYEGFSPEEAKGEPQPGPLIAILRRQRDEAEVFLKQIIDINEALW